MAEENINNNGTGTENNNNNGTENKILTLGIRRLIHRKKY